MYIPRKFRFRKDTDWLPDVEANPFATVISVDEGKPVVTQVPIGIRTNDEGRMAIGHVSKDNPIWKCWTGSSVACRIVFTGANAYVSPMTYQDAIQVPTWNYTAIHLIGHPIPLHFDDNPAALHNLMDLLIEKFEPTYLPVWQDLDIVNQEKLLRGIVGFRMQVIEVECVEKLSQNRTQRDAEAIAAELREQGNTQLASRMLEVRS
jgi:transcriptional regulator